MHVETENDISLRRDNDYGGISLIIDIGKNGKEKDIQISNLRMRNLENRSKSTHFKQT